MKIRMGFVSNSSTTSFCIYGTHITDLDEEEIEKQLENNDLEYHYCEDGSGCIGRSWDSIGDNETGAEFKKSIEDAVKRFLGNNKVFTTIKEAYYNG